MNKGGRTIDDFKRENDPLYVDDSPVAVFPFRTVRSPAKRRRYIFTAAQNATPVHPGFWGVLKTIADTLGAEIHVLPIRYKNPTSRWLGSQEGVSHWAAEVRPHLVSERVALNENLTLLADMKLQPTAADPVGHGDLAAISGAASAIVGHPKIQTRSIATPQNRMAKLLMTSGICTEENYSDTRAGRVGAFHHSLSAVLVELDGKRFYARRLHYEAKSKSVTDSAGGRTYYAGRSVAALRPLALVTGDLHNDYSDPAAVAATDEMIQSTRPRHVIWHDASDGYSVNHHHGKNPFYRIAKRESGRDDVHAELERLVEFFRIRPYTDVQHVLAASNHTDDHLARWVAETDWREDPTNAEFYLETALALKRATKMGRGGTDYPSPFKMWLDRAALPNVRVLDRDESFVLAGVALDMHGDKGPNGARGSIRNLRRIGVKSIIGHGHSPGEDEGATQVGTLSVLRREYNTGPSSWLHANAFLGADGKRQLIIIVDGKYKL